MRPIEIKSTVLHDNSYSNSLGFMQGENTFTLELIGKGKMENNIC